MKPRQIRWLRVFVEGVVIVGKLRTSGLPAHTLTWKFPRLAVALRIPTRQRALD